MPVVIYITNSCNDRQKTSDGGIFFSLQFTRNLYFWLVDSDGSCQFSAQVDWLGLTVGGHPALSLHSSNEPGELSQ